MRSCETSQSDMPLPELELIRLGTVQSQLVTVAEKTVSLGHLQHAFEA